MLVKLYRYVRLAFLRAILSEQVRPFVWLYYIPLWVWGFYGTFFAAPVTYVEPVMGNVAYHVWVVFHLLATSIVLLGLHFESKTNKGYPPYETKLPDKLGYIGIHFQAGGHGCMFFVLLAYEMSAIDQTYWGAGSYSIFVIAPYVVGCLMLTFQAIVKLAATEEIKRNLAKGDGQ